MRKAVSSLIVLLITLSLSLTLVPRAYTQTESIEVVSYSWYVDSLGYLMVVGEVQNTGLRTIKTIVLSGAVFTSDAVMIASSYTYVWVDCLLPQQKAPFYMEFTYIGSDSSTIDWASIQIDHVEFAVMLAEETTSYQYPYLSISSDSYSINEGEYWVSGTVQNLGTQTAENIRVVATFYNATGCVVGAGYTDPLTPTSLQATGITSFQVAAFDQNQSAVPSSRLISSYALLVQVEKPILNETAPSPSPTATPTPDVTPTQSPAESTMPSPTQNPLSGSSLPPEIAYSLVAMAIIGIAGVTLLLKKRKSKV